MDDASHSVTKGSGTPLGILELNTWRLRYSFALNGLLLPAMCARGSIKRVKPVHERQRIVVHCTQPPRRGVAVDSWPTFLVWFGSCDIIRFAHVSKNGGSFLPTRGMNPDGGTTIGVS